MFLYIRSTWILIDSMNQILDSIDPKYLLPNSNVYSMSTKMMNDVLFYEVYKVHIKGDLIYKPWGTWNANIFLHAQSNKWMRRKDLSELTIRVSSLEVRSFQTKQGMKHISINFFLRMNHFQSLSTHGHTIKRMQLALFLISGNHLSKY